MNNLHKAVWFQITNNNNNNNNLLWDSEMHTDHLISARRPDLIIINKKEKKRICKIVDFAVPADHRIKLKECEKKNKYFDLARELKKLWNMKVTWKLADEWRPSKRQHYRRWPEYWEEFWRLEETFYHSNSSEKPSTDTDVKNSKRAFNDSHNNSLSTTEQFYLIHRWVPNNFKQCESLCNRE